MSREGAILLTWSGIRTVVLSEAESKAMAWNLKEPFNLQLKILCKKAKKEELRSTDLLPSKE